MKLIRAMIVCLAFALVPRVFAADEQPATAPATEPSAGVISAGDKQALQDHMDKEVTVEGVVADAKWSSSGKVFVIKFKDAGDSRFQAATFSKNKDAMEKAFDGDLTKALEGAKIQVKGKLQTFKEHPEILVDKPEQITVTEKAGG
jgi:DNA/RNA endonuclease YhcR with UshA esterase domain